MAETKPRKGYESLKAEYDKDLASDPHRWKGDLEKILARAQQYADILHVDRDAVLEKWEEHRTYWWPNYYQECNFPDLSKKGGIPVFTLDEWIAEGERLFGEDRLDWKFRCPACGHIHSYRDFKQAGVDPDLAPVHCASRHGLGGNPDCKWTTGGFLKMGGCYVINHNYMPVLVFAFADNKPEKK